MSTEFMVNVNKITCHYGLLSNYLMEGVSELDQETRQIILDRMKDRQNGVDVRIVIEGVELPFHEAEKMLNRGFEKATRQALKTFVDANIRQMQEDLEATMRMVIQSFGAPGEDEE